MKRIFFLLVACFCSCGAFAQSGFFVKNTHIEKWYREGENLETEIKKAVLLPEFQAVIKEYEAKTETLTPFFHFIDFDNNGELDMLFDGKIGSQNFVFIFLKKGKSYLVVLEQKGTIIQANLPNEDNGLNLSIWKDACCGDLVSVLTQMACISTNNASFFNTAAKSLVFRGTYMPTVRIETPVKCTVVNLTDLRIEPNVDKQRRIAGIHSWEGNHVGSYSVNATGTIYAEIKDGRNKYWYFVRMNNESGLLIRNNRFTHAKEVEDAQNCFYYGWISSDDVEF
ncbi:MAG: hypothetical protein FWH36_00615 [Lentimicrobiaceae bacterium]|nr:hypothetical protein [Lentimicrobiaceae bacterium]